MSRVIYRERERETDYEEPEKRTYTTVKRYQVPDRDSRSTYGDDDVKEEKITIKRTEGGGRSGRSEVGSRVERDKRRGDDVEVRVIERERSDGDRRDVSYRVSERESDRDRYSGARSDFRVVERERGTTRAPSPPGEERTREWRFERERDYSPARSARDDRHYDVERYTKSTEYYSQPQPIIIRERAQQSAPIIITEERREPQQIVIRREEPHYEIIEKEEVRDDRQLVRRDEGTVAAKSVVSQKPQDEDYYYERRVREVTRDPRRQREDDIKPSESASQAGSDESYEYVRRERYIEDERDRSPHHKRHLAEGALAGAGVAAIVRQHRKSQGREARHGVRDVLGGAALGAVGAEVVSRAKSLRASSRRRSYVEDDDRSRDRRRRSRSRSRSQSKSRAQKLGSLAAVAAVGALAGYALKNSGKIKEAVAPDAHRRRSRSRRRRGSSSDGGRDRSESRHMNPEHRNRRIAQAGLATAAAAGIWDRMRSKSRGGRERSKSRIRTAAPILGAGLGGAALAGLYEKTKANKEAQREALSQEEAGRGRRHRSRNRSRSRSRSVPPFGSEGSGRSDRRDMVAYGADPIHPDEGRHGYRSDEEAGTYRRRHGSAGSSPDNRHRSRSRNRGLGEAGAAAVAGAAIGHQMGRRQERERRHDEYDDHYSDDYRHGGYITPPANDHYPPQAGTYPNSNYFAPPPNAEGVAREGVPVNSPIQAEAYNDYPTYNPATYQPGAAGVSYAEPHYADPAAEAAAARELQEEREIQQEREARRGRNRNDPGNVSTFARSDRGAPEV